MTTKFVTHKITPEALRLLHRLVEITREKQYVALERILAEELRRKEKDTKDGHPANHS